MEKNEEKRDGVETNKDSLMWSEEDYETIQKITGFDDESVLEDQKKGVSIVILFVVCIVSLIVGIVLGYNISKRQDSQNTKPIIYNEEPQVIVPTVASAYTKVNNANELYLYITNSIDEEFSIMQLNNTKYYYEIRDNNLYVLVDKDGLNLYEYSFNKNGYHRELLATLSDRYEEFNYKNELIMVQRENYVRFYTKSGVLFKEIETDLKNVLDYTEEYMIYNSGSSVNIYNFDKNESKVITEKEIKYLLLDENKLYYLEENKIVFYDISSSNLTEITSVESNNFFVKVNDYYLYNDGKSLYVFDTEINKIKDFNLVINEIAYINPDNLILILSDYDNSNCTFVQKEYNVFNIDSKSIIKKKISGCLKTEVINDLVVNK